MTITKNFVGNPLCLRLFRIRCYNVQTKDKHNISIKPSRFLLHYFLSLPYIIRLYTNYFLRKIHTFRKCLATYRRESFPLFANRQPFQLVSLQQIFHLYQVPKEKNCPLLNNVSTL